jgi:hypothetical protein
MGSYPITIGVGNYFKVELFQSIRGRGRLAKELSVFNPLQPSGNYMLQLFQQPISLHFVFMCFVRFLV